MNSFFFDRGTAGMARCRRVVRAALGLLLLTLARPAVAQAQTISSFAPAGGPAGTSVTFTGTGLSTVTGVRFGTGTLTTNFVSQSATSLTVLVPVVAASGGIVLTTGAGVSVGSATAFTYVPRLVGLAAVLSPAGPLDVCQARTLTATAVTPAFATGTGFDGDVYGVVVQADGKVLAGGGFTSYNGTTGQNRLIRLNADGSRDAGFATTGTGFNNEVYDVAVQADGKVLVGGFFTGYNGTAANYLLRLNADGSRDATFATGTGFSNGIFPSSIVHSVVVQADGKVLVGGGFAAYNGTTANRLVRLNADGSRDATFNTGTGFSDLLSSVVSVAVQADGKVLVGGSFTTYNGTGGQNRLLRLNADGSRDATFATSTGFDSDVRSVAVQADGKVLAGGSFTTYQGAGVSRLVRLNADGSRDATFVIGTGFDFPVLSVAVQADGKVLVGGPFTSYRGTLNQNGLIRLNADGSRDAGLATGAGFFGSSVQSVAVQADGQVLAGGSFDRYNNTVGLNRLVRLNADGSLNAAPTAVSGASFTFSPGNTTTNPLVTSTTGSYTATASLNGETTAASNAVVLTVCPPTIGGFAPASGLAGTSVTLTGTNLGTVTGVRFGTGTLTTNFVSQSATSLTVRVPVVASTGVITLTNNRGGVAATATAFTYVPRQNLVAVLSPAGPLVACGNQTLTATAVSPALATGTGFDNFVETVVVEADGQVLVGGLFTGYNGTAANRLVRLNADGSRDATFATGTGFDNTVRSVAVLANGQVLAGGDFTAYNGTTASRLVRLNADGSRDAGFVTGAGFNGPVRSVVVQADGRVLVGGDFTSYNGTTANRLVRLNADGSLDAGFATGTGFNDLVTSVAVQADGRVLVGGNFTAYNGATGQNFLVRLNLDGSRDATFATGAGFNGGVTGVAVQADGRVLAGGNFTAYNGTTGQNYFLRLNADGSRDAGFATGTGFNSTVNSVAVQANGQVLAGGQFTSYNGTAATRFVRLNADGSLDAGFATGTGFNGTVLGVAVQADGKLLAAGSFTSYNGATGQSLLVRLNADGSRNAAPTAATANFTFSPGNTTANPLVTVAAGSYSAVARFSGEASEASNAVVLTACPVPVVTGFTPASGLAGTSVTLTGTGLNTVSGVRFGTGPGVATIVAQSATSLTVRVPVVAATGVITVTDNFGGSGSSATAFAYVPRRNLTATLSPAGPLNGCLPQTLTATASSPAFATGTGFDNLVRSVAVQADGRVLMGGNFTAYNGTTGLNLLVHLNADGTRDATFATGTGFNANVEVVAVQADGKLLAGGRFTTYNGTPANHLVRLNADGSLDAGFAPGTGFNGIVYSVVTQADGKLLVGGTFTSYNGTTANRLVRLNTDGTRDAGFAPGTTLSSGDVNTVAVQADGKVLVGGSFTTLTNPSSVRLVRLNANGSRDATFATGTGFNSDVETVAVQADGKVLVGGRFVTYNGATVNRLVRLNANGSLDAGFATGTGFSEPFSTVNSVAVQADGQVLVGGGFTAYNGTTGQNNLIRLSANGSRDAGFATGTGFNNSVNSVAVQADGQVLAGGGFTSYNGTTGLNRLIRLNADGSHNAAPTAVAGASFTFSPGNTTANPLVTSAAGSYTATASLNGETSGASNAVVLTACPPVLTGFMPASGPVGTVVSLTGTNLTGATAITFSGSSGNVVTSGYAVASATSITGVVVPAGAITGTLTVTTAGGTSAASSGSFTVTPSLSGLVLSAGTLSPAFAPGTLAYTAAVPAATTSLTVTPTANGPAPSPTVNGTAVASGSASGPIALAVGSNTIAVALDGVSYTLTVTRPAAPLPVELTAFTAQAQGAAVALTWRTASETNSARFEVERSADGRTFGRIGTVAAAGSSSSPRTYGFLDTQVPKPPSPQDPLYYRLRQVDADGTASYSPVRSVTRPAAHPYAFTLAPNPAGAAASLDLSALPAGTYYLTLFDLSGRLVLSRAFAAGGPYVLALEHLPSGLYQVLVRGTAAQASLRLFQRLAKE